VKALRVVSLGEPEREILGIGGMKKIALSKAVSLGESIGECFTDGFQREHLKPCARERDGLGGSLNVMIRYR
jgi:hypothetical protein